MSRSPTIVKYLSDLGVERSAEPGGLASYTRVTEGRLGAPGDWQLWLYAWNDSGGITQYWEIRATDVGPITKVLAIGVGRDVMTATWTAYITPLLARIEHPPLPVPEPSQP